MFYTHVINSVLMTVVRTCVDLALSRIICFVRPSSRNQSGALRKPHRIRYDAYCRSL